MIGPVRAPFGGRPEQVRDDSTRPKGRCRVAHVLDAAVRRRRPRLHAAVEVEEIGDVDGIGASGELRVDPAAELLLHQVAARLREEFRAVGAARAERAVQGAHEAGGVEAVARAVIRPPDLAALPAVPERQRSVAVAQREAGRVGERGGAAAGEAHDAGRAAVIAPHVSVRVWGKQRVGDIGRGGELPAHADVGVVGRAARDALEVEPGRERGGQHDAGVVAAGDRDDARPARPVGERGGRRDQAARGGLGVEAVPGESARARRAGAAGASSRRRA